jgi:hypothetical protein
MATAKNEVAEGIAPRLSARDDMVDGAYEDGKAAQTVKAQATLARMDGLARSLVFEEIGVRNPSGERQRSSGDVEDLPVAFPKEVWHLPVGNLNGGAMKRTWFGRFFDAKAEDLS